MPGLSDLLFKAEDFKLKRAESLEMRRLRADMLLVYKILVGLVQVNSNSNALFMLINQPRLRGHEYVIVQQRSVNSIFQQQSD